MNHRDFLSLFESQADAALCFGVKVNDIGHWKVRGIPARRWLDAERIAKARGWSVRAADLARTRLEEGCAA